MVLSSAIVITNVIVIILIIIIISIAIVISPVIGSDNRYCNITHYCNNYYYNGYSDTVHSTANLITNVVVIIIITNYKINMYCNDMQIVLLNVFNSCRMKRKPSINCKMFKLLIYNDQKILQKFVLS